MEHPVLNKQNDTHNYQHNMKIVKKKYYPA